MLEGKLQADGTICFVVLQRKKKVGVVFIRPYGLFFMNKGTEGGIEKNLKFCFQWVAHKAHYALYKHSFFF